MRPERIHILAASKPGGDLLHRHCGRVALVRRCICIRAGVFTHVFGLVLFGMPTQRRRARPR